MQDAVGSSPLQLLENKNLTMFKKVSNFLEVEYIIMVFKLLLMF